MPKTLREKQEEVLPFAEERYKQLYGTCGMHGLVQDVMKHSDQTFTEEEILEHFKNAGGKLGKNPKDGITGTRVCEYAKEMGWIEDFEQVRVSLNPFLSVKPSKLSEAKRKLIDALQDPDKGVLGGFFVYSYDKGEDKIPLDRYNIMVKPEEGETITNYHLMDIFARLPGMEKKGIVAAVENTWGEHFGLGGTCFFYIAEMQYFLREFWILKYKKDE